MSDPIDTGGLKDYGGLKPKKADPFDIQALSISELIALRADIDARLPATSLKDFDVEEQTLLHYHSLRELQKEIADDDKIPTNQKAQVANSISASLREITKMRTEIYNAEQFRRMEAALAKALRGTTAEFQKSFFELYGKTAEEMANG